MGLFVFLIVTAAMLPGVICLFLLFWSDGLSHGGFCTWCYLWMGEGLGVWQLWRATLPEAEISYLNGFLILGFTNIALMFFLIVRSRRRGQARRTDAEGN